MKIASAIGLGLTSGLLALPVGAGDAAPAALSFSSVPVPRQVVAALAEDDVGRLWVGSGDGLLRWDGYRLEPVLRAEGDAVQRNLGWVRALLAGPDRMWIGSETDGLLVYELGSGSLRALGSARASGPHAAIRALARQGDTLWVGTLGDGLLRWDAEGFTAVPGTPRVLALHASPEGQLWIGHAGGLAQLAPGRHRPQALALGGAPSAVAALTGDAQGRLWFGLQDGRLGRWEQGRLHWLSPAAGRPVQALALDAEGRLWVGRGQGLDLVDADSGQPLQALRHHAQQPAGLAGDEVSQLLRDRSGALWVGGLGVGLQRQQRSSALRMREADTDPASPLHRLDARALLWRAQHQQLLLATHAGAVVRMDRELRVLGLEPLQPGPVIALAEGASGELWWVGGGWLHCRSAPGANCGRWRLPGPTTRLRALPGGELIVGLQGGGWQLRAHGQPEPLRWGDGHLVEQDLNEVLQETDGSLLAGGSAGLLRRPAGERLWRPVAQQGLSSRIVLGLLRGRDGSLWVDTAVAGLHRLRSVDAAGRWGFDAVSQRHGAVGMPFGANLHEDRQGRIWSQTHVYDPSADRLHAFTEAEGLRLGTPWFFATAALPDGRLLFGGSHGLLVTDPARWQAQTAAVPVLASRVAIDGQTQPRSVLTQGLMLGPAQRAFSLEFAGLHFDDPQRLQYRHRLAGLEDDWQQTDASQRVAAYGQLPPGRYQLQVQARLPQGAWGEPGLQLAVQVAPAWWQRPSVQLLAVALLLLAVWNLVRLRTAQLRHREARLQALVEERTAALREAALSDPLTGLRNRRYLMQRVEADLALAERRHRQQAEDADLLLFLIDLDHFKRINDELGHHAGDRALQQTAERLRQVFRDSDSLVRWGGEEFLALAYTSQREHAPVLAERLREAIGGSPMLLGSDAQGLAGLRRVTASIGFAVYPPQQDKQDKQGGPAGPWGWPELLHLADAALYAAKAAGRDTWVGVDPADCRSPLDSTQPLGTPGLKVQRRG